MVMKTIDRYILFRFIINFIWLSLAFLMIFIIVDLVENFDKYIDNQAATGDIISYYVFFMPWIFVIVSPVGLLLSAIFTGNSMAKTNEVVACKSAGMSSFRLGRWVYLFGLIWSFVILVFGEAVVPPASQRSIYIKDVKLLKRRIPTRIRRNIHILGENGETYSIKTFNPANQTATDVAIVFFDESSKIQRRIDARSMRWRDDHFELSNVYIRTFDNGNETFEFIPQKKLMSGETPQDFIEERVEVDEMGFFQLYEYIQKQIRLGRHPVREITELYMKVIFPFSNLIILLFALPIALHMRKSGAALGFAFSFVVAFLYFAIVRIGQSLGHNETLSPIVAASLGNIIFGAIGIAILFKYRD